MLKIIVNASLAALLSMLCLSSCDEAPNSQVATANAAQDEILFIGTYTQKEGHVDGKANGIYVYSFDAQTGALTYLSEIDSVTNPSYITPHPSGDFLYAVNEIGEPNGTISAFAFDANTHQLRFLNQVDAKGKAPCYLSTDSEGRWAFAANYVTGNVSMFPIDSSGRIGEAVAVLNHSGKGTHPRQNAPHAHFFAPTKDGKYAYAVDLGTDELIAYDLDLDKGGMVRNSASRVSVEGAGPRHLTWHPTKPWVYVINELNGTIEQFVRSDTSSILTYLSSFGTTAATANANAACADIHITPNGKFLYGTNRGSFNSIAMYQIDQMTGALTMIGMQDTRGRTPRNFVISKNGNFLLVANQDSDNVVVFGINRETGLLEDTGVDEKVMTPVCLKFR